MRSLGIIAALLLTAVHSVAFGADNWLARGIDPVSTKLAIGMDSFLSLEGARTMSAHSHKLQCTLDFASGLMAVQYGHDKVGNIISHRLDLHLSGALAVTDWAEVGLDVPLTMYQGNGFDELRRNTGFSDSASHTGLGDIRALGKVRLLRQETSGVTVAAIAEVRLPTGDDQSFMGERSLMIAPRLSVERTFKERIRVGLEGGYRYRASPGRYINLYVGDELALGLSGALRLPELPKVQKYFRQGWVYGELVTATPARAPFTVSADDALKTPLELLLGIRGRVAKNYWATLGGGTGISTQSGFGRESFRLFASISYERFWADRDGDGIPDDEDQCPDQPEDKDGFQDDDGCPDPDNDGDGILDGDDLCPNEPGPKSTGGCPDTDKDGIPDKEDRCPKILGPKNYDGCPDTDNDEVPDIDDQCPDKPGPASNNGCPVDKPAVVLEQGKLVLKDTIHFDTDRASIKKTSYGVLNEVAKILKDHPEAKRVRISGHTDNVGGAAYNNDLSQRRAQAVVTYLIGKGVEAKRLSAKGYGFQRPIAPNMTALGRALNRRVEFNISEKE